MPNVSDETIDVVADAVVNMIQAALDEAWVKVYDTIPSRHLTSAHRSPVRGSRRTLGAAAYMAQRAPLRYLEVGCRRGHSLAMVMLNNSGTEATVVDMWIDNYGDEPNSLGAVMTSMRELGVPKCDIEYVVGDSHQVLPTLIEQGNVYDLIMIDGDHTVDGARRDLLDCLHMLDDNGVIVFDDAVPELKAMVVEVCEAEGLEWVWLNDEWETPWMVLDWDDGDKA